MGTANKYARRFHHNALFRRERGQGVSQLLSNAVGSSSLSLGRQKTRL